VENLLLIGLDPDILTEAVHSQSQTIDSRHFAGEFIRRRKLADKGITPDATPSIPSQGASSGSGGWSEVAKKGPAVVQESPSTFKVVAAKKKGGKR
jgi:PERQ amino acid-rich with GYF domain-containing protein